MAIIRNSSKSLGHHYPVGTGRLKQVVFNNDAVPVKVALLGDSTLDNGYWVDKKSKYKDKRNTVTHQVATALGALKESAAFEIGNFAVDGATTADISRNCYLNKVLPSDEDHPFATVNQLNSVNDWEPDVAVLSVAGNNYREALASTLLQTMSNKQILLRITPEESKAKIKSAFDAVKQGILNDYKAIIDNLISNNSKLSRIVLVSQYYPAITELTPYFIYTGFSHLARAEGSKQPPFELLEETMNVLYREILAYAAKKELEIVFVDTTSSLNPLAGNHSMQIEPNEKGSAVMGKLIAGAISYKFPEQDNDSKVIPRIYIDQDEELVQSCILDSESIPSYRVKPLNQFIRENRYRHFSLLLSPKSDIGLRLESTYHCIMGKQFDREYRGLFAFGLLDLSLVSIIAHYLWRVAIDENVPMSLRVISGTVAAPILLSKMVLTAALMLVLTLPVWGYHELVQLFNKDEEIAPESVLSPDSSGEMSASSSI